MFVDEIHTEYCMMETFQPRCWKNEVILMTSSVYGRMDRNARCLESDPWKDDQRYMDCSADVLSLTDRRCSGRRECDIALPNTEFHRTKPCGTANVINMYLEASFECVVGRFSTLYIVSHGISGIITNVNKYWKLHMFFIFNLKSKSNKLKYLNMWYLFETIFKNANHANVDVLNGWHWSWQRPESMNKEWFKASIDFNVFWNIF